MKGSVENGLVSIKIAINLDHGEKNKTTLIYLTKPEKKNPNLIK